MNWNELSSLQPKVVKVLTNAIKKEKIAHAYIFEGSKGIGKFQTSLLYAKSILCLDQTSIEPCNNCKNCNRCDTGNHPDIVHIKPDGTTIKKEQIELLQREFSFSSFESGKKLYIIESAEKMTASAANSLLKFLEEPTSDSVAMLLTQHSSAMLTTIISRCQLLRFTPVSTDIVEQALAEQFIFGEEGKILARLTNDVEEAKRISEELILGPKLKLVQEFIKKIKTLQVYQYKKELSEAFTGKEGTLMFYDLLILWFEDFLNYKTNRKEKLIFDEEILKNETRKHDITQIVHMTKTAQKYQQRVYSNVSFNALFDGFLAETHCVITL
ncbi:DNA polymerase III subunit delta' [Bacillus cereus]|nr:DNA polymerase III subunit delta' [Bacillus cereus]